MVAAFDYCLHGRGGAAPSIDTAMHGLVDAAHVDHLHPDSGIALATAADGEALTRALLRRPRGVGAVAPARASSSASTSPRSGATTRRPSAPSSAGTGSPPGATRPTRARPTRSRSSGRPSGTSRSTAEPTRSGPSIAGLRAARRADERRARAAALLPVVRGLASTDRPQVGHFTDDRRRPRLPAARRASAPGGARDVVPGPLPADEGPAAGPRPAADRAARGRSSRACASSTRRTATTTRAYYERHATPDSPPMRGADPAIVLVPGVGMFSFGANKQTARVAGEFYVNAINVMRGAEARLDLRADPRVGEVPDRVLGARGGEARADAGAEAARRPGRVRDRRRLGHRPGDRPAARRRGRVRRRRRHRRGERRGRGPRDRRAGRRGRRRRRRHRRGPGRRGVPATPSSPSAASTSSSTTPGLSISKPLLETTVRRLGPPARRHGARLVPRRRARRPGS